MPVKINVGSKNSIKLLKETISKEGKIETIYFIPKISN